MWISFCIYLSLLISRVVNEESHKSNRARRYLLFTPATQFGIFGTVSLPLHPNSYTSVSWFFEANYYNVDNATYFEPLLGDIITSREKTERSLDGRKGFLTRRTFYKIIESLLEKHEFDPSCLLRAICENVSSHFLHNGVLGDLLYIILTPSTSMAEDDLEDYYYEAEYLGMENECEHYHNVCLENPLDLITVKPEYFLPK